MDTEEMYRRGTADAQHGEPHPFYYEHYYQYRRGYDRARRSLGLPGGFYDQRRRRLTQLAALSLLLIIGAGAFVFWRDRSASGGAALQPPTLPALPKPTSAPTRTPIFATATPQLTPTQPALQVGASAQVSNTQGASLRSRRQPSLNAPTTANFKEGERVKVIDGPVEADGFTWWKIEGASGAGWSAQQSPEGLAWLQPTAP